MKYNTFVGWVVIVLATSGAHAEVLKGDEPKTQPQIGSGGLKVGLGNVLNGSPAETPIADWGKGRKLAEAPAKTDKIEVAGWDVEPIAGAPGVCQIAHGYKDKDDNNAENAIVIRGNGDTFVLALSYAKWDWTAGQKMTASLTTADNVLQSDAEWTADTTGKVLLTKLPASARDALAKTEEMTVKFTDGDAAFETPKLGEALQAMEKCAASHK